MAHAPAPRRLAVMSSSRRLRPTLLAPAAAGLALAAGSLATASTAGAATFSRAADGAIEYTAAPGEVNRVLIYDNDDGATMTLYDSSNASNGSTPDGCTGFASYGSWQVSCPYAPVRVDLGDGNDRGAVASTTPQVTVPVSIDGGPGNDELIGNAAAQILDGGPGDDTVDGNEGDDTLRGGDGNDTVEGGAGSDHIDAGAGDDLVSGDGSEGQWPDVIDGGPGTDRIATDFQDRSQDIDAQPPVNVTLGGDADDGRPGEGDDVRNVERVLVNIPGTYVGTDAPEDIEVHQVLGSVTISGGGGDDTLVGPDGADHIDGGPGDDTIDAGYGDDTIVGGPGRDTIRADRTTTDCGFLWCKYPYGNDSVDAVDGEVDSISCGAGTDTVRADPQDVVAPDCENVTRAGGGAASGGGSASAGNSGGDASGTAPKLAPHRVPLATALRHGLVVKVSGAAAGAKLALTARSGKRTLGTGRGTVGHAGTATIKIRFSAAGRRWAAARKRVSLTVSGGGASAVVSLGRNP